MILGVSFDSVKENRNFARKFDFPFPLLSDPERRTGLDYHAATDPEQASADRITYLIDPEGIIARVYETIDVKSHPGEVLSDLEPTGTE